MSTSEIINSSLTLLLSVASFIIGYFQYREKGFLFNNAYIYASKEERKRMNKKPYYRQSAIVFTGMGIVFLVIAAVIFTGWIWLHLITIVVLILSVIYAIASFTAIERSKERK